MDILANTWGEPQTYNGLKIHPIKLNKKHIYDIVMQLLSHNKNVNPSIEIIKMSYLKFILLIMQQQPHFNNVNIVDILTEMLNEVLQEECEIRVQEIYDEYDNVMDYKFFFATISNDVSYSEGDFDKLREIILEQNGISLDYINQYDPTLEEHLSFYRRKDNSGTFEENLFSFCAYMKLNINDVKDYTFYQYGKMMDRIGLLINFQIYKPLEASGQISTKGGDGIDHWTSHIKKRGRYDEILIKKDEFVKDNDIFQVV